MKNDVKSMLERLKELKDKIHNRQPRNHSSSYTRQIHSVEKFYEKEYSDQGIIQDDNVYEEDFGTLTNAEACYAEVNMTEAIQTPTPWFLDSGVSHMSQVRERSLYL